jgi:uncharacterized protein (DUF2062 family)
MNLRRWLQEHSLRLLAIRDTPEAIAGGVAIGLFFGFTPLFGLKTVGAILLAWLTRSNIIAAVLAGTMHDLALPFMPVVFRWEYDIGFWLLSNPHHWPQRLSRAGMRLHQWRNWTTFLTVGKPLLLGSVILGAPVALVSFVLTRSLVSRHQRKKAAHAAAAAAKSGSPPPGGNAGKNETRAGGARAETKP